VTWFLLLGGGVFSATLGEGSAGSPTDEVRRVVLVKTHKTGSSTLANILFRFGEARNLSFVLPDDDIRLGWPGRFPGRFSEKLYGRPVSEFDMVVNHAVFNFEVMSRFVPNARFISVVRQPLSQFLSAWNFFSFKGVKNMSSPVFSEDEFRALLAKRHDLPRTTQYRIFNSQSHTLGFTHYSHTYGNAANQTAASASDRTLVQRWMDDLFSKLSCVLVIERFDESLVVMAHALAWRLEDVAYIPINVNRRRHRKIMPPSVKRGALELLTTDSQLYDRATQLLEAQFHAVPGGEQRLELLQRHVTALRSSCSRSTANRSREETDFCWRCGAMQTTYTKLLKAKAGVLCSWPLRSYNEVEARPPPEIDELFHRACISPVERRRAPFDKEQHLPSNTRPPALSRMDRRRRYADGGDRHGAAPARMTVPSR